MARGPLLATTVATLAAVLALAEASAPAAAAAPSPATVDETLARGQDLLGHGQYRDTITLLEPLTGDASLTAAQRARLFFELAAAHLEAGPDTAAMADADRAERDARAVNAYDLLARIESVRGIVWLRRGRSLESLKSLKTCLEWAQKSGRAPLVAGAYIRLAAAYQDLGDWTRALDAVNRSAEADPSPSDAARVQYLTRRGLVLIELHENDAAKASVSEAVALARTIGDRRTEAQVLIDLALVSQRTSRRAPEAAAHAAEAVAIARDIHNAPVEIAALNQLGSLLIGAEDFAGARDRLLEALAVIAKVNERRDEPYVLRNLGEAYGRLGRQADAERTLRLAAERADAAGLTRVRWVARLALANALAERDPDAAGRQFEDALAVLEERQTNVLLEGFRPGALDPSRSDSDPYDRYVTFLLERGQPERAFHTAERERARVFLDALSGAREAIASAVPASFRDAENATLRRISAAQAELRAAPPDQRRRDLVAAIDQDEQQLNVLRVRLAAERPALAHARYPKLVEAADLRSTIVGNDEAIVSYFLGTSRSVCWILTRGGLTTLPLPPRDEIERLVRAALQELRDPVAAAPRAVAPLTPALAVDAIAKLVDGLHLVVIPHGILYDLPFEVLRSSDGRLLVERFPISYAPSAASLAFFRSLAPPARAATTLLAIGDPVVRANAPAATRQADLSHVDLLAPLPNSAKEISGIASLFGRRVRVLEGGHATERELLSSGADQAQMLHFATHGLIDEIRPERSGLVLTANPPADDGLLQTREIYGLKLHAALVTLSGCQTALGQNVTGEGMIGLTRAFFYAGARAVVSSLWDVEDAATARLMQQFYRNIQRGQPIDVALQQAKLEFIRPGGGASRPFVWASFIANGQARAVVDVPPPGLLDDLWRGFVAHASAAFAALLMVAAVAAGRLWRAKATAAKTSGAQTS